MSSARGWSSAEDRARDTRSASAWSRTLVDCGPKSTSNELSTRTSDQAWRLGWPSRSSALSIKKLSVYFGSASATARYLIHAPPVCTRSALVAALAHIREAFPRCAPIAGHERQSTPRRAQIPQGFFRLAESIVVAERLIIAIAFQQEVPTRLPHCSRRAANPADTAKRGNA